MKKWKHRMRFNWKPETGRLDKIFLPYTKDFTRKGFHLLKTTNMFNNTIGMAYIKGFVRKLNKPAISDYFNKEIIFQRFIQRLHIK